MRVRNRSHPLWCVAVAAAGVLYVAGTALAKKASGENVHRMDGNCRTCHTADATELNANRSRAMTALQPNLEATCNRCHGAQGPSHKTNVAAKPGVPSILPLSVDGKLTCATCHYMHGENNQYGDFLRIDNRRGKLCLTCHKMSELEK